MSTTQVIRKLTKTFKRHTLPPKFNITQANADSYILVRYLKSICKEGQMKEAMSILQVLDHQGIWVDYPSYSPLVQGCINTKSLAEGKLIHAHMIETAFRPDMALETKLVIMYAKCRSLADARRVMNQMPKRDAVSWSALIAASAKQGQSEEALELLYQMQKTGVRPDQFTFASVLPACGNLVCLEHGREVHGAIIVGGFGSDVVVGSALVVMYVKTRTVVDARKLFDKMPERNVFSWTAMIVGYVQVGCVDEAANFFRRMPERDLTAWNVMIAGYAHNGQLNEAKRLFRDMPERNVVSWTTMVTAYQQSGLVEEAMELFQEMPEKNTFSWTAMITGFAQNRQIDKAMELFEKMPERDHVSWNAMIAAYAQNGQVDEARNLFDKMPERGLVSWNAMIAGYVRNRRIDEALKLFENMPRRDLVSWNTMIAGYAQDGFVDEALKLFEKMPRRVVVSWNTMIAGYAQNGHFDETLKLFREMLSTGVKPDAVTFSTVLPAFANLSALQQGKEVHEEIIRSGFQSNAFVASALIDMYAKCGSIEDARNLFDKRHEQSVVLWNVIIKGYGMHGYGKEAIQLFEQMEPANIKPDSVTFVGILSACCHAGLVDDGQKYFHRMTPDYGIIPVIEHYCCMVDLLSRAGRLDEVLDFINKMPIKPDTAVWGSLLGACRVYNNIELGQYVAERLFELDSENSAHYVLLSNIYATSGKWNDTEIVRKLMRERKVKKMPGRSWIEVNNKVHTFLVGDRSHEQTDKIYELVENLSGKMKEAGYVPDRNFVLHDVEEQQKELLPTYLYHSWII